MAKNPTNKKQTQSITFATILVFIGLLAVALTFNGFFAKADPEGATLSYIGNSTKGSTTPGSRSDPGGYIHTMNLSLTQQNSKWKAYVGNVSGSLTLDDSNDNTIYDWALTTISGEVFASRSSSITWSSIGCAATANVEAEDTAIGFSASSDDTVNKTFSGTTHKSTIVAGNTISNSTCRAIATYVSDSAQASSESASFQELLLYDTSNIVYATLLENDAVGYDGTSTYDFQMIVPDNETTANTLYYFYAELG